LTGCSRRESIERRAREPPRRTSATCSRARASTCGGSCQPGVRPVWACSRPPSCPAPA